MRPDELAGLIDETLLKPTVSQAEMEAWLAPRIGVPWASVCVPPVYVETACRAFAGTTVKVCAVVGFPLGYDLGEAKSVQAALLVERGAREIDMVGRIGALLGGEDATWEREVRGVVHAVNETSSGEAIVKVILETAYLDQDTIRRACTLAEAAGAAFVKTSTGFGPRGASIDDVRTMREALGDRLGIKAAGGIRTLATARAMLDAGATRLGTSAGLELLDELRASA